MLILSFYFYMTTYITHIISISHLACLTKKQNVEFNVFFLQVSKRVNVVEFFGLYRKKSPKEWRGEGVAACQDFGQFLAGETS